MMTEPGPLRNRLSSRTRFGRGTDLCLSRSTSRRRRLGALLGHGLLFLIASSSTITVLFILWYIAREAIPFFQMEGLAQFFTSLAWRPTGEPPEFGALAIFYGSATVIVGSCLVAVPLGVAAAVCLSDVLPFRLRQIIKPIVEVLAAVPSVAYGFFALVVFAPLLHEQGARLLSIGAWIVLTPVALLVLVVGSDLGSGWIAGRIGRRSRPWIRAAMLLGLGVAAFHGIASLSGLLLTVPQFPGTNALNASIILGVMALPTIVSVSEDALAAAGRELREGSYALGATRAETILKVIIPAARSGIFAAVILGVMRALGETMVVWMASGNAAQVPEPFWNVLQPVRTLTATIAAEMGETSQQYGASHYHALFAMALTLLVFSLIANLASEWIIRRAQKRLGK
jgi:phosphate transport system permease protein